MNNEHIWCVDDDCSWGQDVNGGFMGMDTLNTLASVDIATSKKPCEFRYTKEDVYKLPMKRIKKEHLDVGDATEDMNIMIAETDNYDHIQQLLKPKQEDRSTNDLNDLLEAKKDNEEDLLQHFTSQLEVLEGKRNKIEKRIATLVKERDENPVIIKMQMEKKIIELTEQVHKYSITQGELLSENKLLKENLWIQRQDFLEEVSREDAVKREMIKKLEDRIREQETIRLKEQQQSSKSLNIQLEKLKNENQKQIQEIELQKWQSEQDQLRSEQQLNEHIDTLVKEKEEIQRSLSEAKSSADQAVQQLLMVSSESNELINSLQEQLAKETNRCAALEQEKKTLVENLCEWVGDSARRSVNTKLEELGSFVENELTCIVCAELLVAPITLNCSHTFCHHCIITWKKNKNDCPMCRARITAECKSLVLETFIEKMIHNLTDDMKKKREDTLRTRREQEAAAVRDAPRRRHPVLVQLY